MPVQNEKSGDQKHIVTIRKHRVVKLVQLFIMHNTIHRLDYTVMIKF